MSYQLFSATGCSRCKIVKSFMDEKKIAYAELDIKAQGKEAFKAFYRSNRPDIFRGEEGIEFPILFTGEKIYQGVGIILAFLMAENRLEGFVTRSVLSHGWVSGLNISAKPLQQGKEFLCLVAFLKAQGLMVQLETDGRNSHLLERVLREKLVHRLVFHLQGPADLYEQVTGLALAEEELFHSLSLLSPSVDYRIVLPVSAFTRKSGEKAYLTPEEAARAAQFVEKATGSKKQPFFIDPAGVASQPDIQPLPPSAFFKYRTQCRRYMVLCEILKY